MSLPNCPKCGSEYVYEDGNMLVCPECFYEWAENGKESSDENVVKDSNGNIVYGRMVAEKNNQIKRFR